jgi:Domain of unknown function (DUF4157)
VRVQDSGKEWDRGNKPTGPRTLPPQVPGMAARVLALQRLAGNAAVSNAIADSRYQHGPTCGHADTLVQRQVSPGNAIVTPGKPLPARIVERMEQEYPVKLGHVHLHDGPVAQRSAADHCDVAYTTGSHSISGRSSLHDETMFHEAGHVWQQAVGRVAGTDGGTGTTVSSPRDPFEVQAAQGGPRMAQGQTPNLTLPGAPATRGGVQRAAEAPSEHVQQAPGNTPPAQAPPQPQVGLPADLQVELGKEIPDYWNELRWAKDKRDYYTANLERGHRVWNATANYAQLSQERAPVTAPKREATRMKHSEKQLTEPAITNEQRASHTRWLQDGKPGAPPPPNRTDSSHQQVEQPVQRSVVADVLGSPGRHLDDGTRTDIKSSLRTDCPDVRAHTEPVRRPIAEIGARPYTFGSHVVLGKGGLDQHTLTWTIQQRQGPVSGFDTRRGFQLPGPADKFECEVDSATSRTLAPAPPASTAPLPSSSAQTTRSHVTEVQRTPRPSKKVKLDAGAGQKTLMQSGLSAPKASKEEEFKKKEEEFKKLKDPKERHNFFITELQQKFEESGWKVTENKKYATKNDTKSGLHSFKDQRELQSLRWISTVVKSYLMAVGIDPIEVQAAIGENNCLIIAANTNEANEFLRSIANETPFIDTLLKEKSPTETGQGQRQGASERSVLTREGRHFKKLKNMYALRNDPTASEKYEKILRAIGNFEVAVDGGMSLHAERRIKLYNSGKTPKYLAGTKRPCATCFSELYPEASQGDPNEQVDARPGAFFFSKSSNTDIQEYKNSKQTLDQRVNTLFKRIDKNVRRTYYSTTKNGDPSYTHGSDSDSDYVS